MIPKQVLLNSKLCFGPMSLNIVDEIIKYSETTKTPITFIPSRRQIEYDGGYVNNWTTEQFIKYVKSKSNLIAIQRDHSGPGQGKSDDDGYTSLKHDCKYLDAIHIDPWKKYPKLEDGIKWTLDMINYCHNENPNLYYEVGTEEAIRRFEPEEINIMLEALKTNLDNAVFTKILFCVIQSGTSLKDGVNTGLYSSERLKKMISVVNKYNIKTKEHNGDYMPLDIMKNRFENNLDSINIAPELGVYETKSILKSISDDKRTFELFYKLCYESGKWKKWVSTDFKPEDNKHKLIELTGHYIYSNHKFNHLYNKLSILNLTDFLIKKYNTYNK